MDDAVTIRNVCLLCGTQALELAVPLKPSPIADAYWPVARRHEPQPSFPLDLYLCLECGHVQLRAIVNADILFRDYIYQTSASASLLQHFEAYADDVVKTVPSAGDRLSVDIGSNDGAFLRMLKARGFRVRGVDPATRLAAAASASGIPTVNAFFTSRIAGDIRATDGPATLVTANNVFAHSETLPDMADGIRQLLADDGVFVFEVSYLADIVDNLLFDTVFHEHLSFHSIKPLQSFLARHGLDLFDVVRIASKGGSIRVFAQKAGGNRRRTEAVDRLLDLEAKTGLDSPATFQRFSALIDQRGAVLRRELQGAREKGPVVGFGASATVTTLMFHYELASLLDYLVDDNASRHGLLSPGARLEVKPSATLYAERPPHAVILAWQYAKPIAEKHRRYVEQGGRFIVPLPQLQVVAS